MDLYHIIDQLVRERTRVQRIIESLEAIDGGASGGEALPVAKRRGRRSMDGAARREVSERMKQYWAKRRAERKESVSK